MSICEISSVKAIQKVSTHLTEEPKLRVFYKLLLTNMQ